MGAVGRPVRTKRPSRRAAEAAAGGQFPFTRAESTKRPGRSANEAPVVVGKVSAEAAERSASRVRGTKRRRTAQIRSPPPRVRGRGRAKTSGSHPLRLDPCSNRSGKRARSSSDLLPRPQDNNNRKDTANLLDDGPAAAAAAAALPSDNYLPCPPDNNNIWYVPSEEAFPLVVYSSSHDCDSDPRDWASLADGPAGLIAERVLAYDVADYVRFRAVCRPWRQCSTEPCSHSGLDRRFHPWRWTMLREELAARSFLNTSTGQCVQVNIPELCQHDLLALTPEGLLVLVHKPQRSTVRLLNPLTRQLTELPPLTTLLPSHLHRYLLSERDVHTYCQAWGSGIASDDSTVVLCFNQLYMLGIAKPGDDHWTVLNYNDHGITTYKGTLDVCRPLLLH